MSIALLASASSRPASGPALYGQVSRFDLTLLALGIVALLAVALVRAARPRKLTLRGTPGRPNRLDPALVLGLYLLSFAAIALSPYVLARLQGVELTENPPGPPQVLFPAAILGQLVLVAGGLVLARRGFRGGLTRGVGLTPRRWLLDLGRAVIAFLAVWPVCVGLLLAMSQWLPQKLEDIHPVLRMIRTLPPGWMAVAAVSTVVLAPLAEELFFRGLVQSLVRRHLGPWPAVLATSAVFAAAHYRQPQAVPSLLALAVVLGYSYERTGRLLSPMLIHAGFNAVNLYSACEG
jgi:membrane protease YdiL (CAAX protease family)